MAVQEASDIALHMAADEGWGVPPSYGEGFLLLADHGIIDRPLATELAAMAALRNRLAHGYASVDAGRVWNELPSGIASLEAFSSAIARRLGVRPDPGNAPA